MKKIIVACGGAVATSTVAANRIKQLCMENNIDIEIVQCRISEIEANLDKVSLIATTMKTKKDYGDIPVITVMGFISGINEDALIEKILKILK
ncbi:PTS galactitol transporter subunit IIB [Oceanivirga salmonicida]|uniref:PTS galactitol transporter subunit IIB n=1 Tax=Oceanivirga salmonicida TaxID=1769291 RepID=UPI00082B7D3E|nr:PTS galactitol transporter subunit IIB [Oceanivirga salmonicida]